MLTEACATGKPVYMFDPDRTSSRNGGGDGLPALRHAVSLDDALGSKRLSRDIGLVHRHLLGAGMRSGWVRTFPNGTRRPCGTLNVHCRGYGDCLPVQIEPAASRIHRRAAEQAEHFLALVKNSPQRRTTAGMQELGQPMEQLPKGRKVYDCFH